MGDFKLNAKPFQGALREYGRATNKDAADILNRAGRNVALRAVQLTPKATAAKIRAELAANNRAIYATIRRLKRAGVPQRGMSRTRFAEEINKTIAARRRSAAFVSSGWFPALADLGGRSRAATGSAAKGSGKRATERHLLAVLINAATGANKVGREALQQAVDFVARDMLAYAQKKLADRARQFSAR